MRKKLILGVLGLVTIVGGLAAMSAFTAQMVNIQARVEKDITVEPIICDASSQFGGDYSKPCWIDPNGGNYGVTLPQEFYDKEVEVTLSNSFEEQDQFFDLLFDVLWECKQFDPPRDVNPADTIPDCREDGLDDSVCAFDTDADTIPDTVGHCDPQQLDGNIRDHIIVNAKADPGRCDTDAFGQPIPKPSWEAKKIVWETSGILNKAAKKCRYELKFFAPPCEDGFNPYTDPHPLADQKTPIFCHKIDKDTDGNPDLVDPQDIDEFADLGDEFKIQIFEHSLAPGAPGEAAPSGPRQ